jgi:hypothetical protein
MNGGKLYGFKSRLPQKNKNPEKSRKTRKTLIFRGFLMLFLRRVFHAHGVNFHGFGYNGLQIGYKFKAAVTAAPARFFDIACR